MKHETNKQTNKQTNAEAAATWHGEKKGNAHENILGTKPTMNEDAEAPATSPMNGLTRF